MMESNAELARLEEFVNKLLVKYNELKEVYHTTRNTLREREAECADLKDQVAALSSEKSFVGEKVAGLIDRIEQWEAEDLESPEAEEQDGSEDQGGAQGSLFETESELN